MNRTDIHRPSAPEFDPENYDLVDVFDLHPEDGDGARRVAAVRAQLALGRNFSGAPHGSGQCSHCGAYIRYAALMVHTPTNTLLYIGETCLDGRFAGTKADFDALRRAAKATRAAREGRSRFEMFCTEHPSVAYATYAYNIGQAGATYEFDADYNCEVEAANSRSFTRVTKTGWEITTLSDLAYKADRYGELSDKQLAFIDTLLGKLAAAEVRAAGWAAEAAAAGPVPTGRVQVEGEVIGFKTVDSEYGTTYKMILKLDNGSKVYLTVPSSIDPDKGARVRLTVTIEASADDANFGFGKRPTKAEVMTLCNA